MTRLNICINEMQYQLPDQNKTLQNFCIALNYTCIDLRGGIVSNILVHRKSLISRRQRKTRNEYSVPGTHLANEAKSAMCEAVHVHEIKSCLGN